MTSTTGIWPGGGLFVIPASRLGPDIWAYTTFGLTNPDMPTTVAADDVQIVERHAGLTVEEIETSTGGLINVIIAKARAPLPGPVKLPNGTMQILVATSITAEEMTWSFDHGRPALLERLAHAGIGQMSVLGRPSTPL